MIHGLYWLRCRKMSGLVLIILKTPLPLSNSHKILVLQITYLGGRHEVLTIALFFDKNSRKLHDQSSVQCQIRGNGFSFSSPCHEERG